MTVTGTDTTGEVIVVNHSGLDTRDVMDALGDQHNEYWALAHRVIADWTNETSGRGRKGGIFERDRYLTPKAIFRQFSTALDAAETDDVVSGVLESTESLAFSRLTVECEDPDEENIWNQILDDLDIYSRAKEMWRELFIVSQFYAATLWGNKSYKVEGKTDSGNKKRKSFSNLKIPTDISILDPLKIVPVGNFLFGKDELAWIANRSEAESFDSFLAGNNSSDLVVSQLISGKYNADKEEKKYLSEVTQLNMDNLFTLNPKNVWRHTATRPSYQRFATVRMKSIFELLDLKQQLRQADRAHLIGNTNFIVLITKGSDELPAKPAEMANLANQVRSASRVPVLIGDHRLHIEIITPDMDTTIVPEKYNTLDARIAARMFQLFLTGNYAAGAKGDDSIKLARVVARGLEARRHMIGQSIYTHVIKRTMELNKGMFTSPPELHFHPKRLSLDFDPAVLEFYQELRDRGDLSRETILSEMDLDQAGEAMRRDREKKLYDDTFKPPMAMLAPGAEGGPPAPPLPPAPVGGVKKAPVGGNTGKKGGTGKTPGGKTAGRSGGRKGGTNSTSFSSPTKPRGPAKALLESDEFRLVADYEFEDDNETDDEEL